MEVRGFQELLKRYIEDVKKVTSEANKSFFFIQLVQNTFRANIDYLEKVFPQIEKFVEFKGKIVVSKGEIDSLLGNVVIEFESNIERKKDEAERQLKKYISILWNSESREFHKRVSYVALATDGLVFHIYRPESAKEDELSEEDISLIPIEEFMIENKPPREVLIWLDSTFLSKEARIPTAEDFKNTFGVGTNFYKTIFNKLRNSIDVFKKESRDNFDIIFSEWSKYLSIAYGSSVENENFFIKHTYLSILAKLMIYSFFSKGVIPIKEETISDILGGEEFKKWGIRNFFEEDFFSWIIRNPVEIFGVEIARDILNILSRYDLTKLNEDILKGLYENLLDQRERHDLGEVYTPDWLVEYMLRGALKERPEKTLLDPACGSGTFLFTGIRLKKEFMRKLDKSKLLYHILEGVKGIDIHPLAILIAKTNYLLGLGDLVKSVPRGEIILPIYMADSIRLIDEDKEFYQNVNCYKIPTIDEKNLFFLPCNFIEGKLLETEKIDSLIDLIKDLSLDFIKTDSIGEELIEEFLSQNLKEHKKVKEYVDVISVNVRTLARIAQTNKDTIWAYILKNKYKPIDFAYRKFDLIVGNPPWIVYNSVKNVNYQQFLKKLIKDEYNLTLSSTLITNMEIATLFYLRCLELYSNDFGEIAFVMPRSVFSADQHSNFRNGSFKRVKCGLTKIWDLENVSPLFRVPACVVFGHKNGKTKFPINAIIFEGKLREKNESYAQVVPKISMREGKLFLSQIGKRDFLSYEKIEFLGESHYYKKFYRGAEILPQSFWFVEISETTLGYDVQKPYVNTPKAILRSAKKPWNDIIFEGNIEDRFVYDVVIGSYMFPFSFKTSIAVLPIEPTGSEFRTITQREAVNKYPLLAEWLGKAERLWQERRKEKQKFDIYQWIDYNRKLTKQNPRKKYKVFYNETGKDVVAAVAVSKRFNSRLIFAKATIYYETDNESEAYYLASFLNAPVVNHLIKPMQAKGLFGERGIEKKVLELPIPKFNEKNRKHKRLAELGKQSTTKSEEKLNQILAESKEILKPQHIARIRKELRENLKKELEEITDLTEKILKESMQLDNNIDKFFK